MNRNDMIYYSWVTSAASGCKFSKEKYKEVKHKLLQYLRQKL